MFNNYYETVAKKAELQVLSLGKLLFYGYGLKTATIKTII